MLFPPRSSFRTFVFFVPFASFVPSAFVTFDSSAACVFFGKLGLDQLVRARDQRLELAVGERVESLEAHPLRARHVRRGDDALALAQLGERLVDRT